MNYADGREARIGDRVRLGADDRGVVVCSIDRGEYSSEHPREKWGYLGRGIVVDFPKFGIIHYTEPEEDLVLLSRST